LDFSPTLEEISTGRLIGLRTLAAGGNEAKRAFGPMMGMKKIDIAAIEAA